MINIPDARVVRIDNWDMAVKGMMLIIQLKLYYNYFMYLLLVIDARAHFMVKDLVLSY